MTRRTVVLTILSLLAVCALAMPSLVTAKPLREAAWKRYVDGKVAELYEYIDERIAAVYAYVDEKIGEIGGGGGEDFDLPNEEYWTATAYTCDGANQLALRTEYDPSNPGKSCSWNGVQITHPVWGGAPRVDARAVARYSDETAGYALGCCRVLTFLGLSRLPEPGETIDVEIWFFWLGTTKETHLRVVCGPRVWEDGCQVMQCAVEYAP